MSATELELANVMLEVVSGSVDIFVLDSTGRRFPIGTLSASQHAIGFDTGPTLIAKPQYDAEFRTVPLQDAEVTVGILDFWLRFVADFLTDEDYAEQLVRVDPDNVPNAMAVVLSNEIEIRERSEILSKEVRGAFDAGMIKRSIARIEHSITHPRSPVVTTEHGTGLLQVVRHVADYTGFQVVDPAERQSRHIDPVRLIARVSHVPVRRVVLRGDWINNPVLALVGTFTTRSGDVRPVALLPKHGRYVMQLEDDPEPVEIDDPSRIGSGAYEFYPNLPADKEISPRAAFGMGLRHSGRLWAWVVAMAAVVTALSLITPLVTQWVWSTIVPLRERDLLIEIGAGLFVAAIAAALFTVVQEFTVTRIDTIASLRVQAAIWSRMLGLPATFFRQFTTGDLATRIAVTQQLALLVNASIVSQVLGAVFSLANLVLLFYFDSTLAWVAVGLIVITLIVVALVIIPLRRWSFGLLAADRASNAWMIQLLTGVQKIRMAGIEDRMTAMQTDRVRVTADMGARQTLELARFHAFFAAMGALVPFAFIVTIGLTWTSSEAPISTSTYVAFLTAFGTMFGSITAISALAEPIALFGPMAQMAAPMLRSLPERATHVDDPGKLTGELEFHKVTFRYPGAVRPALESVSFKVQPGEFVAVVGPTGSGKTSVVRQILAFEEPESGELLLDGRNLRDLDLDEVRGQIGVVLQDGQLSPGSMFENITAGTPGATEEMAWLAAERAALVDDILDMPLGIHTMVTPETISGGQAQRVLLARALLKSPAIMLLDEATSALDNTSQKQVTASLQEIGCTRIVIAHRLSTIKQADRIVVMDQGRVVDVGSYNQLMDKQGLFAELASRQGA